MQLLLLFSDVLAEEAVLCLQKALTQLREIWEFIGIPEDQRLQRTEVVQKHIKASLALVSLQWVGVRMLVSHSRWHIEVTLWCHRFFLVSKSFFKILKLQGFWCYLLAWGFFLIGSKLS